MSATNEAIRLYAGAYLSAPENSEEEEAARLSLDLACERLGLDSEAVVREVSELPRCEKCQAYEHEADECPHDDDDVCTACERPSLDCSRDPCVDVVAERGEGVYFSQTERDNGVTPDPLGDFLEPPAIARPLAQAVARELARHGALEPGVYSVFVIEDNGTWSQPSYLVPAGWTENEVCRAVLAGHGRKAFLTVGFAPDPDCPERDAQELPDVEIEPDPKPPEDAPAETMTVAVLSTVHLSKDEGQRRPAGWPTHCHESEYGFVVHVGDEVDQTALDLWPGFRAARDWAKRHGIEWLRFDADGPVQFGLPTWTW